jgi:hypothetical protein
MPSYLGFLCGLPISAVCAFLEEVDSGWQWLAVVGSGWQWLAVVGSGWQWLAVVGSGWQWSFWRMLLSRMASESQLT